MLVRVAYLLLMDQGLWAAIVTGVVAIAAGYLGAMWGRNGEHRIWLRNEKMKLYSNVMTLLNAEDLNKLAKKEDSAMEVRRRRDEALLDLSLVADLRVSVLAQRAAQYADDIAEMGPREEADDEEWSRLMTRRSHALMAMIDAMRLELRVVSRHERALADGAVTEFLRENDL
jgi:hypothetical protein